VGVFHVHHAPSHDANGSFEEVLAAAHATRIDFLVLTEHVPPDHVGPPLAAERAGVHVGADGHKVLVLVGAELGTLDGHLIALQIERVPAAVEGRRGRDVIHDIHALGGFAVVPHPFAYGGWSDWEADFDGLEVQNNASDFRRLMGLKLPWYLLRHALDPAGTRRAAWVRPARGLARWEELLRAGRDVVAFAGADAHRNVRLLGRQLDPYADIFAAIRMHCPPAPLEAGRVWSLLRGGGCVIRYAVYEEHASEAERVVFPSGRSELQLNGGERVLEIRPPVH
jgi:hypothetical protein